MLADYGAKVREAVMNYLPDREPRRYLYDLLRDYPERGGRMMRPTLCIATTRAFGGRLEDAISIAASLELIHNAALIHDDIEDESLERRGRPTMHVLHGTPMAINAGDALMLLSFEPLLASRARLGNVLALRIVQETARVARETAEGQAIELGWRQENVRITEADYLNLVLKKTCWLTTIHPLRLGGLIGTRGAIDPDRFVRLGFFLGAAFQVQDDLLNLIGDHARYGKELEGDLLEGKRSMLLVHLWNQASDSERERIDAFFDTSRAERQLETVRWIRKMMDHYDCIDYVRQFAHGLAGAAANEFDLVFGGLKPSDDRDFVEGLVTWVLERV